MSLYKLKHVIAKKLIRNKKTIKYRSKPEQDIHNHIDDVYQIANIEVNNRKILKGKELDIYLPNRSFGIEYNGLHWHSYPFLDEKEARKKHIHKTNMCDEMNVNLLHIWEDEWLFNKDSVLNLIDIHINPNRVKTPIKQLKIKKIKNKKESYSTFEKYSIQRLNKSIKHDIYQVDIKNNCVAFIQMSKNMIVNIAIHNSLISLKSVLNIAKRVKANSIYIDKSTGIHNMISGKILKNLPPKSRKVQSKKRKGYTTNGNRIWDSGHCIIQLM